VPVKKTVIHYLQKTQLLLPRKRHNALLSCIFGGAVLWYSPQNQATEKMSAGANC